MTTDFKRVLIANRGEIALRVVRACRDASLTSIAVYAEPDAGAPFARLADEALPLRGTAPADTYLDVATLLAAAGQAGAEAVHPGYGFLAEDAGFAQAVLDAGLAWIGPPPAVIRALGDKVAARAIAARAGAPLLPGTNRPVAGPAEAVRFAEEHGLPIAIKAAHGGGGRGLRVAREAGEVAGLFEAAVREARAAFGRGECFVEAYVEHGRHVEAQVLADVHGDVLVAGTRDCTLQRRYQKLVEEAPAPFLTEAQRTILERSAEAICREAGYVSAGTVEFLLSPRGELSFLEVNTRLQVEHTVTEESADIDLVRAQLLIAAGHPLAVAAGTRAAPRRHAIEFRINAEDPAREFAPSAGRSPGSGRRPGPGYASTPASRPAASSAGSSTRCWPSWSSPAGTGRRPSSGHAARSASSTSPACTPPCRSSARCWPSPPSPPKTPAGSPSTPAGSSRTTSTPRPLRTTTGS